MKKTNLTAACCVFVTVLIVFVSCGKKSNPAPKPDPTPPAPKTIANGTYEVTLDQLNLGGGDTTYITRSMPDCETKLRYTFMNGNYTFVDACDNTTLYGTYTYNSSNAELKIISPNGYALITTVSNLSANGFLWIQPQGFGQTLRMRLSRVSN